MDVYYWFYNMTKFEINTEPVYENFVLPLAKGFGYYFNDEERIKMIEDIIERNEWEKTDTILIIPDCDYCMKFIYKKGEIIKEIEETKVIIELRESIEKETNKLFNFEDIDGNLIELRKSIEKETNKLFNFQNIEENPSVIAEEENEINK